MDRTTPNADQGRELCRGSPERKLKKLDVNDPFETGYSEFLAFLFVGTQRIKSTYAAGDKGCDAGGYLGYRMLYWARSVYEDYRM